MLKNSILAPSRIVTSVFDLNLPNIYFDVSELVDTARVYLKIEGINPAGSIKLKTAIGLIESIEVAEGSEAVRIIESSSGNLGVALALVCKTRQIPFTCVIDPNTSRHNELMMRAFGATVVKVDERDENGGYLKTRIDYIKKMLDQDPSLVWINQYANKANIRTHYETTAREIFERGNLRPDVIYVGTGTTGTFGGLRSYIDEHSLPVELVAVEPVDSVTFKHVEGLRSLPGIGTSRRPELADYAKPDRVHVVDEVSTKNACRRLLSQFDLLLGASTGSVVAALMRDKARLTGKTALVVAADMGSGYLDTIYS